ncbi:GTPase IMAP family member 8-like isoform X2 [Betta splendens]|uniref:GTPase IMAP family member 8-like isoform X2 n=1 Tax=Betta splendens TaxID=158456 RepID=A0A9W2X8T0_BETSP|nr:GTPase IMAP family member 8-like isoform X2 [Betta splendens]
MSHKSSASRYKVHHDNRLVITLFGKSAEFRNTIGNKILKNAFSHMSDCCVTGESSTVKIINTPDFFDEDSRFPDQHIIDCMALSYPGPNLVILAVDSKNSQDKEVIDQINKLQYIFGENITANLVVLLPTTDVLKSPHHLKKRFRIHLKSMSDKLNYSVCSGWCSGQWSFQYNFNNYSEDVVLKRKSTLDKRRCSPLHHQENQRTNPQTSSSSQRTLTANTRTRRSVRWSFRGSRASAEANNQFNIVLLGLTGTGKSASANTILAAANLLRDSSQLFKSELSSVPVTTKCEAKTITFHKKRVTVVDTPDFFNEHLSESKAQTDECRKYCELRQSMVLIVLQLGRFTDQEVGILEKLEDKLSLGIRQKTVVLLTHGDGFRGKIEKFIDDRRPLKHLVEACGNRYHVFNNTSKDPRQVLELIKKFPDIDVFLPELTERRSHFMCLF